MAESNPGSSDVDGSLEALSYLLLCKDYHSHQADAKVEDWRERIRPVAQEFRNRRKMVSQIKSLKATVAQYEQEPSRTNELNKKIEDLETNASVLENRISLAETELQTARKLGKRTQKLLEASHTRVSQLESDLQTCIDRHTEEQSITEIEWTSVVSRLQDDLGESQRDLEESRSYRKEQEAGFVLDQSSASLQIFTLHAELKTTRADLKKTQSQLDSTETKFHALQSSTSSRLSELQAELDTAQAEAHNHQSQIESKEGILHAQQQSTSATIATFQIELANTQADLRASQVQLTENKATLQSHQSSSSATMLELSQKFTHSVVQETLLSKKAASLTVALKEANNIITAHQVKQLPIIHMYKELLIHPPTYIHTHPKDKPR